MALNINKKISMYKNKEHIYEKYSVSSIEHKLTYDWFLHKHYAHRIPTISYAFGLFNDNLLIGVCTFGSPAAPFLKRGTIGDESNIQLLELNRLCVNDGLERNVLSFFVSRCLKMLPKPTLVVSYADSSQHHHGYIYQATNWIYTGLSLKKKDYLIKGHENDHARHQIDKDNGLDKRRNTKQVLESLSEKYGSENVEKIDRARKYRYFYFVGNKKQIKSMKKKFKYKSLPYPKGDNVRYDTNYKPTIQLNLF